MSGTRLGIGVPLEDSGDAGNGSTPNPHALERITASELATGDYRVEFLVKNALVAKQPCIMAGGKKALKTNVALDLGISLATGTHFLGRFDVPEPRRVAFLSGESGLGTIQETAHRICAAREIDLASMGDRIIFGTKLPRLASPSALLELGRYCRADLIEVLIVDPAYLCMDIGGNESSLFAVGSVLVRFAETCIENEVTPVLIHHTKKIRTNANAGYYDPPELEDIAFAGFQEYARQWLLLGRREAYEPGSGSHRLWLNAGGSVGHSGLWGVDIVEGQYPKRVWDVEVVDHLTARAEAERNRDHQKTKQLNRKVEERKDRIRGRMRKLGTETKSAIRSACGISTTSFDQAWFELLDAGEIETVQFQKHTRNEQGWRLVEVVGHGRTVVGQSDQSEQSGGGGRTGPL